MVVLSIVYSITERIIRIRPIRIKPIRRRAALDKRSNLILVPLKPDERRATNEWPKGYLS